MQSFCTIVSNNVRFFSSFTWSNVEAVTAEVGRAFKPDRVNPHGWTSGRTSSWHSGSTSESTNKWTSGWISPARLPPRSQRTPRPGRTAVFLLMLLTAGAYIPSPFYTACQQAFGFSDLMLTAVYATFAIVSAPALLLFGSTYDSLGPRPVLRVSVIFGAIGSACFLLASGPLWLLAGRAAQGIALGAVTGAATAVIVTRSGHTVPGRASFIASIAFVAGTAIGPLVAGGVARYVPGPLAVPYIAHLGLLAYGWVRVERLGDRGVPAGHWRPTWPQVPRSIRAAFASAAASGFLAWTAAGIFLALGPSLLAGYGLGGSASSNAGHITGLPHELDAMALSHDVESTIALLSAAIVALVLTCSIFAQLLTARLSPYTAQRVGSGALIAALTLLAITGASGSLAVFLVISVVAGIGHGLAYRGAASVVDAIAPDSARGDVTASLYLAFYLGTGVPTIAVGAVTLFVPLTAAVSVVAWTGAGLGVAAIVISAAATTTLNHSKERDVMGTNV